MESFRLLFSVEVGHEYFADGTLGGLDYRPTEATRRVIGASGAVLRIAHNCLNVYYESGRRTAMGMLAEETGGELRIVLKATVRDRSFRNYTALARLAPDAILCFSNAASAAATTMRLSREEKVSAIDAQPITDLVAAGLLTDGDIRLPPDFVFDIRLTPAMIDDAVRPRFGLKFATRALFWHYFLLGGLNRDNLFIVDLDEKVEFEALSERLSVAQRPARVFRSKTALPVYERSSLRLQLREFGNGSGKVVVRRLPVASDNFALLMVDGEERLVSNMYINF